ncbi:MAG TPA: thioesterase family protein [Gemmatimonadaceae bacterium]|nr:thioesterase family protein [Gemmatimonadaceae bacterium]
MSGQTSSIEFRVRYAETDQMGVVYHTNYLVWCEMGRTNHMRELGASYRALEESGIALAVAEATIRYTAPARYDDLVRVETTLAKVSSRSVIFEYLISHAETGTRLAVARTALVSMDRSCRVAMLPADVRALLSADVA